MKRIAYILVLLTALATNAGAAELNTSLMSLCLKLADAPADPTLQAELKNHPPVARMRKGFNGGINLSFSQIAEQKGRLSSYAQNLNDIKRKLPSIATDVNEFLGKSAATDNMKIHIVCGAPYDGFGFHHEGELHLFANLPLIAPDFFEHLMRHELWHAAYRTTYPDIAKEYESAASPLKQLAYILTNEGVGHYFSFRRRVEPVIQYDNWPERSKAVFDLLQEGVHSLAGISKTKDQKALLFSSHAGVPFWEKWGAVPGAIMTYRLKQALNADQFKKSLQAGPCTFLSTYQTLAQQTDEWERIPEPLLAAACDVWP